MCLLDSQENAVFLVPFPRFLQRLPHLAISHLNRESSARSQMTIAEVQTGAGWGVSQKRKEHLCQQITPCTRSTISLQWSGLALSIWSQSTSCRPLPCVQTTTPMILMVGPSSERWNNILTSTSASLMHLSKWLHNTNQVTQWKVVQICHLSTTRDKIMEHLWGVGKFL